MSYTPTQWNTGDTITASALNKIEQGIANSGGTGYDAELYIYHGAGSGDYEVSIVSGSYAQISAMIEDETPPNILVRVCDINTNVWSTTNLVALYGYYPDNATPVMTFMVKVSNMKQGYQYGWTYLNYLNWNANDEVSID